MFKAEIRIPTVQYGYINVFLEGGNITEAIDYHNIAVKKYQDSLKTSSVEAEITPGLNVKDWQRVLDTYLVQGGITEEDMSSMSERQKLLINEIKKAQKRIENKLHE